MPEFANVGHGPDGLDGYPVFGERLPTVCAAAVFELGGIVVMTPPDIVRPSQPKLGLLAVCAGVSGGM